MTGTRAVSVGAATALLGTVLSGPAGLLIVGATHPQPAWDGPAVFIAAYHPIQLFPYFAGFLLVGGFVVLVSALQHIDSDAQSWRTGAATSFTVVFAAMIFANYAIQTTVVPSLLGAESSGEQAVLATLTMSNPVSLGWGLEMWGYAALGVATWLASPVFGSGALEGSLRALFVANGPISVLGGVVTVMVPGWVLTKSGLVAFGAWNVLIIVMLGLTVAAMRRRSHASQ